ncbi:hypothetical protein DVA67_033560 [Solirubrobacter sp. CPCC 204708]|uniref:Uncharacterized protein n=1 Tax=Solirubrobacter deserti TaxID=2282478 RepID=A0ABT4RSV1_9ACTN|nr:hypothetical protein [Solirubrobacter deserti]MBE2320933.1 hypothetical protein [Solirubrobacter deserti]MDA0141671.1 hypothetical protein [Solirubrobacter deserti]
MRRRRLQAQQPYPIVGKVGKRQLKAIPDLCRAGEQPRFVIAEGIYGALVAFEDRLVIVKKTATTFPYAEIGEIRYSVKRFTGKLEIVAVDEVDGRETFWKQALDVRKRTDAMALTVDVFEKAQERVRWLRGQIAGPRRVEVDAEEFGRALIEEVRDPVLARSFPAPDAVVEEVVDAVLAQLLRTLDDQRLSPWYLDWVADYSERTD